MPCFTRCTKDLILNPSGYMAPEYVVQGKLTEKVDVYSFGVLVIEVVSGKKNSSFYQASVSLLQQVLLSLKSLVCHKFHSK